MPSDDVRANVLKTLQESTVKGAIIEEFVSKLRSEDKRKIRKFAGKVDTDFVLEKAGLLKDTMAEINRNRKTSSSPLLQRNIWSSADAVAIHLDQAGFTPIFQSIVSRIFKKARIDDPKIVKLEWQLMLDVLGGERGTAELGLSLAETQEVIRLAEREKSQACGLPRIGSKGFTLKKAFAEACTRPDKILEESHHSLTVIKGYVVIFLFVVNLVAAILAILGAIFLGGLGAIVGVVVAVLTFVGVLIVLFCGC